MRKSLFSIPLIGIFMKIFPGEEALREYIPDTYLNITDTCDM